MKIAEGITPVNADSECNILRKCGIINDVEESQLRTYIMTRENNRLIEKHHTHKIYQGKDGKWYTYLEIDGKRKKIKRNYKKEIESIVLKHIKDSQKTTIGEIFYEWLERQLSNESIKMSTHNRYKNTFIRHYESTGWDKKHIEAISLNQWIDWIEDQIGEHHLTAKGLSAFMLVTKPIIKRASRRGLIDFRLSDLLEGIEKKPFRVHKSDESEVFSQNDFAKLKEYLVNHPDIHNLALLLMMLTGARIGEICTLRYDDFLSDTCAEIKRTETFYTNYDGKYCYEVKESPKTEAGFRRIYLPSDYAWIVREMKKLRPFSTYLCENIEGERMTAQSLRARLYRICNWIGIDKKSPHKARKTYASIVMDAGMDNNMVISLMGHTNIQTTQSHYYRDRKEDQQKQNAVDNISEFRLA